MKILFQKASGSLSIVSFSICRYPFELYIFSLLCIEVRDVFISVFCRLRCAQ